MHMSDALVSPAVGGALWAVAAGASACAARRLERDPDERRVPLMGVLGAFVFAAQMVSFAIPGTGSSGHLGGALLLSVLLGPDAALLVLGCVLAVQALFFADGGLLALGCNVVNVGLLTTAVAYPLVWRPIAGREPSRRRTVVACVATSVVGLQLGAAAVALETAASGVSTLPVRSFLLLLVPIHLAIGIAEGIVTAAVILAVRAARPDLVPAEGAAGAGGTRRVLVGISAAALVGAGVLSSLASAQPDGLDWAVARTAGEGFRGRDGAVHRLLAGVQRGVALLPAYDLPRDAGATREAAVDLTTPPASEPRPAATPLAGLVGAVLSLGATVAVGLALRTARTVRPEHRPAGPESKDGRKRAGRARR